jgi:hypothetical protein
VPVLLQAATRTTTARIATRGLGRIDALRGWCKTGGVYPADRS